MPNIDTKTFDDNLLLTQAYCELQLKEPNENYASILRSFNPQFNGKNIFSYSPGNRGGELSDKDFYHTNWNIDILGYKNKRVTDLFERQMQHKRQVVKLTDHKTKFKGKILVAEIDETLVDGVSEVASEGVIDEYDCPPLMPGSIVRKMKQAGFCLPGFRKNLFRWFNKE